MLYSGRSFQLIKMKDLKNEPIVSRIYFSNSLVSTIIHKIFPCEIPHYGKSSISLFQEIFTSFEIFLIFPKFLRFLSRSATRETTRIYQFIANNHASFHLWWKENLLNHQIKYTLKGNLLHHRIDSFFLIWGEERSHFYQELNIY